jgi:host factor-I protein
MGTGWRASTELRGASEVFFTPSFYQPLKAAFPTAGGPSKHAQARQSGLLKGACHESGLKSWAIHYIVVTLREPAAPGLPEPCPPLCFFTYVQLQVNQNKRAGDRQMENKPAQNIQDTFLNTVRKDKTPITIYLVSGVKLTGKIRSFDKYSVLLENNSQEQLIFKHAISTVVSNRSVMHTEHRPGVVPAGIGAAPVAAVPAAPPVTAEPR